MIKIKYESKQEFSENPDIGIYAMPKGRTTKKIYFLGIRIWAIDSSIDDSCVAKSDRKEKKLGF